MRRKLLRWYEQHRRDLPWRKKVKSFQQRLYRTWVSEVMLQQTQVATVIDYFNRFVRRFPNVSTLASADEQDVLKLWEGLGYYRRARQLHAAAKQIVSQHDGRIPTDFNSVLALPGIGRYTAGAILSISADQRQPILEGNTERLFARLLAWDEDTKTTRSQKMLWAYSESLLPQKNCSDFNQALMELGSLVCRPAVADCPNCPLRADCLARIQGHVDSIPRRVVRMKYESVRQAAVIVKAGDWVLLSNRGTEGRFVGMWDVLRFSLPDDQREASAKWLKEQLTRRLATASLKIAPDGLVQPAMQLKHIVTRFRISLDVFVVQLSRRFKPRDDHDRWFSIQEIDNLGLNKTARKMLMAMCRETGG